MQYLRYLILMPLAAPVWAQDLPPDTPNCPPGPFICIPWRVPVGSPKPPPPPPFFKIESDFLVSQGFAGLIAQGTLTELNIRPLEATDWVPDIGEAYANFIEPESLYVFPWNTGTEQPAEYTLFSGSDLK